MKAMQPASARALTVTAAVVLFVGFLVPSPSGALLAFGLAALLAVVPTIFGLGKLRLVAVILLLCSAGLMIRTYPDFKNEQERYRQRKPTAAYQLRQRAEPDSASGTRLPMTCRPDHMLADR